MTYCNIKIFQHLRDHGATKQMDVNIVKQNREMLTLLVVDMMMPIATHTVYHVIKFAYFDRQILFFRRFFTWLMLLNSALRGVVTLTLLGPYRKEAKKFFTCGKMKKKNVVVPFEDSFADNKNIMVQGQNDFM